MMLDWTKPLCTKHETPLIGEIQTDCRSGIKRVRIASLSSPTAGPTVYRFDIEDSARQGAGPSDYDLVNYDENDGATRITVEGRPISCTKLAA